MVLPRVLATGHTPSGARRYLVTRGYRALGPLGLSTWGTGTTGYPGWPRPRGSSSGANRVQPGALGGYPPQDPRITKPRYPGSWVAAVNRAYRCPPLSYAVALVRAPWCPRYQRVSLLEVLPLGARLVLSPGGYYLVPGYLGPRRLVLP